MGHFYREIAGQAAPFYEVPKANGEMRGVHVGDARKTDAVPSPNTVMGIHAKPGLIWWSDDLLMDAATAVWATEYDGDWKTRARDLHKEYKEVKANQGTEIHEEIEDAEKHFMEDSIIPFATYKWGPQVEAAINWLLTDEENGGGYINIEAVEKYFVNRELGLGGMIDIVGTGNGRPVIVDWKTVDLKPNGDFKNTYPKDKLPLLAAYAMGNYGTLDVDCWNNFIARDPSAKLKAVRYDDDEILWGWEKFQHCYELWVMEKNFDPRGNNG